MHTLFTTNFKELNNPDTTLNKKLSPLVVSHLQLQYFFSAHRFFPNDKNQAFV